jgi:hypothetical protein
VQQAYDVRSAVVHTGIEPAQLQLPTGNKGTLFEFNDVLESLMRFALVQAVEMGEAAADLRKPQYWSQLVLS